MIDRKRFVVALAAFGLLGAALLKKIGDPDIWYHMTIGREIVRSGRIPAAEFYVYTMLGAKTAFHEHGFGLLAYAAYASLGAWGLGLLNAIVGAASLVMLFCAASVGRTVTFVSLSMLGPLLLIVDYRMFYRAEMYLYLALAVTLWLAARHRERSDPRWLLPIPVLVAILGNIHPSAVILLLVVGAYAVQALFDDRRSLPWLAGILVAGTLAGAANPYGFSQFFLPFRFAAQRELLAATAEFAPTLQSSRAPLFLALCAAGAIALYFSRGRRIFDGLLLLLFAIIGVRHVRNVALFAMVAYGPVVRMLEALAGRVADFTASRNRRAGYAAALVVLAASTVLAARSPAWGIGLMRGAYPVQAADLIATAKPEGRLFNYPHLGGYLAWRLYPGYLVAVDGRRYFGWDKALTAADAFFRGGEPWQGLVHEYGVTMIATPGIAQTAGSLVPVVLALDTDTAWWLVSAEPAALLFVRGDVARAAGIRAIDKDAIWRHVITDAEAFLSMSRAPSPSPWLSLGVAHFQLREYGEAETWLSRYVAASPADASARNLVELLKGARAGDPAAARTLESLAGRRLH